MKTTIRRFQTMWVNGDLAVVDTAGNVSVVWTYGANDGEAAAAHAHRLNVQEMDRMQQKAQAEKREAARLARNAASRARHAAYTSCGMKRTPYGYE